MERANEVLTTQIMAESHVRRAPWFASLPGDLQCLVLRGSRLRFIAAGATVARRGAVPELWTGVVHGVLKASACDSDGRVSSYVLATPSQWINGEELVQGVPRLHDVRAITDSVVIVIDASVFQRLLSSSLEFCVFVLRQTSHQHRHFLKRLDSARSLPKIVLVAQTVAELANDLLGGRTGSVELSQEDIGEFVGLSRQTVNQVLKELAAEGLLRTRYNRVEVADLKALRNFAQFNALEV